MSTADDAQTLIDAKWTPEEVNRLNAESLAAAAHMQREVPRLVALMDGHDPDAETFDDDEPEEKPDLNDFARSGAKRTVRDDGVVVWKWPGQEGFEDFVHVPEPPRPEPPRDPDLHDELGDPLSVEDQAAARGLVENEPGWYGRGEPRWVHPDRAPEGSARLIPGADARGKPKPSEGRFPHEFVRADGSWDPEGDRWIGEDGKWIWPENAPAATGAFWAVLAARAEQAMR